MRRYVLAALTVCAVGISGLVPTWAVEPASNAQQALEQAASQQKYAFIVFYKDDGPATRAVAQVVADGVSKRQDRAALVYVQLTNPIDKAVVDRFDVSRAPMPLTLTVAPNGAITGAFPQQVTDEQLAGAFVTPAMAACMNSMQRGRLVFLCVQTTPQPQIPTGISDFVADPQFKDRSDVVLLHAADPAEADLVAELQLNTTATNPTDAVFFAPPGVLVGKFSRATTKAELAAALHKAGKCCDDPNCKHAKGQSPSGVR